MNSIKLAILILFSCTNVFSQTIYVNGSLPTNGDGTSWATAFNNLHDAIAASSLPTNEIWVAKGTYYPAKDRTGNSNPADNRIKTFLINKNLKLFGGFFGNELNISDRIIGDNPTILSGDLGILNNDSDNSYNVISAIDFNVEENNNLVIDGFTIEKSNYLDGYSSGGGIIIKPNEDFIYSVQIRNSIFINNKSSTGGAICIKNSMKFVNSFKVSNCIFSDNFAINGGGAIFISSDAHCDYFKIPQCFNSSMNSIIENSIFKNNIASHGGAIYNISIGGWYSSSINQCTFSNNEASYEGNAIYNNAHAWPYLAFCQSEISNSIFKDKQNDRYEIFNVTVEEINGIPGFDAGTFAYLNNCLYINKLGNIHIYIVTDIVENSYSTSLCQEIDPLFVNESNPIGPDNKWRTADDGLKLKPCSPAINAGDNSFVPVDITTDIAGEPRIQLGTVDIGAYESNSNTLPTIAMENTSVTANQSGTTLYYSDCDKLIAKVESPMAAPGITPILGKTTAKVWLEPVNINFGNGVYRTVVLRHYEITPENNSQTASGRITLYFKQFDFDDFNARPPLAGNRLPGSPNDDFGKYLLTIIKYPGISSNNSGYPNTYNSNFIQFKPNFQDIIWNEELNQWEISFNVTGFSGFFVNYEEDLPLSLISFSANLENQTAHLLWKTANEVNTKSFEIERSEEGTKFIKIGTVASKNNLETNEYSFLDNQLDNLNSNAIYYRLKMLDLDGKFTYSKIIAISIENDKNITLSPNPTSGKVFLNLGNKTELLNTMAIITNASGMVVKQFKINKLAEEIDLSSLPKAVYLVKFVDGTTLKIIKE